MKQLLITGGSGFIGQQLVRRFMQQGWQVTVFTRRPEFVQAQFQQQVETASNFRQLGERYQALINLAGEGIADKRWSAERKHTLRSSRVDLTRELASWARDSHQRFDWVMSGSAVGYYGGVDDCSREFTEGDAHGDDFSAHLCRDWEHAALELEALTERLLILRTGLVFGSTGGMLSRLWLPFSFGLGGRLGHGQQGMSWIHTEDYCRAVEFLAHSQARGVFNMTAPEPVTNQQFTQVLAQALSRPACFPAPAPVLKLVLGEMSELLLKGQAVLPQQLLAAGFEFHYPQLPPALEQICQQRKQG